MNLRLDDLAIGHAGRRTTRTVASGLRGQARPGELTVLLGPNGAGKTTLLRTVCGLLPALGGRVLVGRPGAGESDVATLHAGERARRIAAVLTGAHPPSALPVRSLVALGRHPHGTLSARPTARDETVVDGALERVGAAGLARRRVGELSDGERQRVLLARALAQATPVLVLDEPTAFLDAPGRRSLIALLAGLAHDEDRTVLLCTHEVDLALAHADHGWLLDRQQCWHTGRPDDLPRGWLDT